MKFKGILGAACFAAAFTAVGAQADTLADYPFTGSSLADTASEIHVTGSAIALGAGLTDTTRFATGNGNPAPALRVNSDETTGTSFATAVTAGDDFVFTITPDAGYALTLNTLTFDLAVNAGALTTNVLVQLSGTGSGYTSLGQVTGFSTTTFTAQSFDLTAANAALAAGLPIYVRLVVFDNASNANAYTGFDNIVVSGTVSPIPEPGTNALLALGALGAAVAFVRRRRHASA